MAAVTSLDSDQNVCWLDFCAVVQVGEMGPSEGWLAALLGIEMLCSAFLMQDFCEDHFAFRVAAYYQRKQCQVVSEQAEWAMGRSCFRLVVSPIPAAVMAAVVRCSLSTG